MINVKDEMPKLDEVCIIVLQHGYEHVAIREHDAYGQEVWYNELHDQYFKDEDVVKWEYFFPN